MGGRTRQAEHDLHRLHPGVMYPLLVAADHLLVEVIEVLRGRAGAPAG